MSRDKDLAAAEDAAVTAQRISMYEAAARGEAHVHVFTSGDGSMTKELIVSAENPLDEERIREESTVYGSDVQLTHRVLPPEECRQRASTLVQTL